LKYAVALLLLVAPWFIFLLAAKVTGGTSTFILILTLAVSAFGFTLLLGPRGKQKQKK